MYTMFCHPTKQWTLGLLYDSPGTPEQLKMFLQNNDSFHVRDLVHWLYGHNVRGVAYCTGGWFDRMRCHKFVNQFNTGMKKQGILADLEEFYSVVMAEEEEKLRKNID